MSASVDDGFAIGLAFVVEGPTERVFYHEYLKWCCSKSSDALIEQLPNKDFVIAARGKKALAKFNVMGSVGSVPNAINWVRSTCSANSDYPWVIVLCYDTDGDTALNLNTRAWLRFREDLRRLELPVIDLAANADIEDIMLVDAPSIRAYLGLPDNTDPKGRKGKAKLNSLYKAVDVAHPYHEGERARDLIRNLNFEIVEANAPIPIKEIRKVIFLG